MMEHKHVLSNHQLDYEEMEQKLVNKSKTTSTKVVKSKPKVAVKTNKRKAVAKKVSKPKVSLKTRLDNVKKVALGNIKKRLGIKSKKAKKVTKTAQKLARQQRVRGIIGIGLLFVVVSITYSTYMTVLFVDGKTMVVALIPQIIFAVTILLSAFYKIYK